MILNKDTRDKLKIGMRILTSTHVYIITNMWRGANGRSLYITIQDTTTRQKIYGIPSSKLYDLEVLEEVEA